MKAQKGFTLIELIIVIVVLGILAVTAAPQFVDFGSDARESSLEGVKGSMNGAADLVYGKAALAGIEGAGFDTDYTTNNTNPTTPADGIEVVFGYPVASTTGIIAALNIDTADWDIQEEDPAADGSLRMSPVDLNDPATTFAEITNCYVEYTNAASDGARPTITITTTGC